LEADLEQCFDDEHVLRVDHFLGDEAIRGLPGLHDANALLGAAWNREWIDNVQISLIEDFGVADRGSFYDPVGCIRDVIQNHLLQVLTFMAMEPTTEGKPGSQAEQMLRLLRAVRTVDPAELVLGQYDGYRAVEGVRPDSTTETYAAMRLHIDDDRWAGVPFYLRSGKYLARTTDEVVVQLRSGRSKGSDLIRFGIKPDPGVALGLTVRDPDPPHADFRARAAFDYATALGRRERMPYETILHAVIAGDPTPFVSFPCVEESWRIVGRVIDTGRTPTVYAPGSWGPEEAGRLVGGAGWRAL
jgi:glucose-6-phosphate 1-dehydrogenase